IAEHGVEISSRGESSAVKTPPRSQSPWRLRLTDTKGIQQVVKKLIPPQPLGDVVLHRGLVGIAARSGRGVIEAGRRNRAEQPLDVVVGFAELLGQVLERLRRGARPVGADVVHRLIETFTVELAP